jgi:hypothetical protein
MTEHDLRALVREAINRHVSGGSGPHRFEETASHRNAVQSAPPHASHGLFVVPDGSDSGGPCLIEPTVMCTHCGYCRSYGH